MPEALFYVKTRDQKVKCELCNHYCLIAENERGICQVRQNQKGILETLVYGKVIAANIDPIEKKPLFHFLPGSYSFSIATVGCNFRCQNCQNADISQLSKNIHLSESDLPGEKHSPEEIIAAVLSADCQSISYTYTEPTIFFEFAFDCMKLAKDKNIKNVWVSNGYTSTPALETAKPYLDAANIDLKFFKDGIYQKVCGARLKPILNNLIWYKKNNIWLEITTLVIPGLNDSEKDFKSIAEFIKKELGTDVPWHLSAFFPNYKMLNTPPTPLLSIQKACAIGKAAGLKYVYGGNITDTELENTFCAKCGEVVIARRGYAVERHDIDGLCSKCGSKPPIIWN